MKIDSITFSPNCEKITVVVSGCTNNITIEYNNIMSEANYTTPSALTPTNGTVTWQGVYDTTLSETSPINGVVRITVTDVTTPTNTETGLGVSSCELYCCVAKLVEEGINCTCNCSKCDEDIKTAEKVHLLIKSAEASANKGNETDAVDKYDKAKNYCTSTCGCGC